MEEKVEILGNVAIFELLLQNWHQTCLFGSDTERDKYCVSQLFSFKHALCSGKDDLSMCSKWHGFLILTTAAKMSVHWHGCCSAVCMLNICTSVIAD